ncbi:MAG: DNA polymerase III subunit gamma/tau [Gemmatimonadota bacterium]|nr:DNA polymerase III subunit gamma/tau [Gemmatimonadota bacterium]
MSHQPLALKYRPATFADVVAQDHVTRTLTNALDRGRIAQAYLFAGPRGTGKTTTARLLAKALNCETGITGEPCGGCANCEAIAAGRSLDVIEIDAASNRGIDDIKELRETVKYAAAQGRYKVYIVDEVHQLSKDAFNAFLKTLEEPPRSVVFVLATTEPHKILPTILSRCQRFDFRPIPLPAIRERLEEIVRREAFDLDDAAGFAIAKKADGSLRDALSLLDQLVAFGGEAVDVESLRRLIGMPDEERYLELTGLLAEGDAAAALEFAREIRSAGYDLEEFYTGFLEHLRNCLLFALGGGAGAVEVPDRYRDAYRETASALGAEDLLRMLTLATDEELAFRRSTQQGLVLEVLLVRLALLDRAVDVERALAALDGSGSASGPASAGNPGRGAETARAEETREAKGNEETAPAAGAAGELDEARLIAAWESVIGEVHEARPTVAAALQGARPTRCDGETIVLTLPPAAEFRLEQLRSRGTLDPLAAVLERRWSFEGRIEVRIEEPGKEAGASGGGSDASEEEAGGSDPPRAPARGPTAREVEAKERDSRIERDPLLKQAVDLFDANVVRVRRSSAQ